MLHRKKAIVVGVPAKDRFLFFDWSLQDVSMTVFLKFRYIEQKKHPPKNTPLSAYFT